ncbi:hypothetical protein EJ110_NYTH30027 [Nymphaea thermarum]|nr:hypothetical protein EJ110_NYTH30027 [Nymphaea thermarum]
MAEEMTLKSDVAFDTSSAPKSKNLPVQVTSIRLTKDNYLSWSAALEIGIMSRGRLPYITGEKPAPSKTDPQWVTWALEDSQVKVWIISSVFADIQPLILRKSTFFDMWTVLARMYGRKKRGNLSVASFYASLKTKWEELDYHVNDDWNCGSDHTMYWEKEWMDRTFLFLGGLRDEFESIRSQILNCDEIPGIEEVYARVESKEQRRQGLGSVLLDVVLIVTNWDILLIFVGIFTLRRDLSEVVLPLVGVALLCLILVRPTLQSSLRPSQSPKRSSTQHQRRQTRGSGTRENTGGDGDGGNKNGSDGDDDVGDPGIGGGAGTGGDSRTDAGHGAGTNGDSGGGAKTGGGGGIRASTETTETHDHRAKNHTRSGSDTM